MRTIWLSMLAWATLALGAADVLATTFTVDPARSNVALSISVGGTPATPQVDPLTAALGNDTTYGGAIDATLDSLASPSSIEFTSAFISANDSGSWLPARGGGTTGFPGLPEAGNYGFQSPGLFVFALRDLAFSLSSDVLPVTGGTFPTEITSTTVQGVVDFNSIIGFGSESLIGGGGEGPGPDGSYTTLGLIATLTLPVDFSQVVVVNGFESTIAGSGQLVATGVVPEPSAALLLLPALAGVTRRRCC